MVYRLEVKSYLVDIIILEQDSSVCIVSVYIHPAYDSLLTLVYLIALNQKL